ncbi:hypothetical protein Tco_1040496 [Tanacetum coccineum]
MSHEARDKCIGGSEQHRREHGHLTIGMVGVQYGAHGSERYVSGTSDSEQYGSEKDDNSEHNKIYALIRGDTTLSWILTWCCNKCCGGGFSDSLGEGRKARAGHKRAGEGHRCIVVMYSVSSELSGTLLWLESGVVRRGESQNAATRYEARAEDSSYTDITVRRVLEWYSVSEEVVSLVGVISTSGRQWMDLRVVVEIRRVDGEGGSRVLTQMMGDDK